MGTAGRPPYQPTDRDRQTVSLMTASGIDQSAIARCLGISDRTLRKWFRREIATAADRANTQVAGALYRKAVSDDHPQSASCAMFWMKTRAGWRDKAPLHDPDDPPAKVAITGDAKLLAAIAAMPLEKQRAFVELGRSLLAGPSEDDAGDGEGGG